MISVNRLVVVPTSEMVINRVNEMRISEKQPEGIQFTDRDGRVSINNFDLDLDDNNDDNSNASDKSFDHNKEYQEEFENEGKTKTLQPMKSKMIIFSFHSNNTMHF